MSFEKKKGGHIIKVNAFDIKEILIKSDRKTVFVKYEDHFNPILEFTLEYELKEK